MVLVVTISLGGIGQQWALIPKYGLWFILHLLENLRQGR